MRVELLLEEPSAAELMQVIFPRLRPGVAFRCRAHRNWQELLQKLPLLLRGYAQRMQYGEPDLRIVVVMDADSLGVRRLQELEAIAQAAGLTTDATAAGQRFVVLNRLAVNELESWLLGDRQAVQTAYPRIRFGSLKPDPDYLAKPSDKLLEMLQQIGLFPNGPRKPEWARTIGAHMDPVQNASTSFRLFQQGIAALR